jgi:ribosome-associated protein
MDPNNDNDDLPERPSKSQLKRDVQARGDLVKRLAALPPDKLARLSLGEDVREALLAAKKMERGALVRQLRYVTGLLEEADAARVARELEAATLPHRREVQAFQEVERWRDALLAGDEGLVDDLVSRFDADRQRLRLLLRNAAREREQSKPPKSARQLFKYLMALHSGA